MHVYIVHSEDLNRYFTGITSLPQRTALPHRGREAAWLSKTGDWKAVWTTEVPSLEAARELERSIRTGGTRKFLEKHGVKTQPAHRSPSDVYGFTVQIRPPRPSTAQG